MAGLKISAQLLARAVVDFVGLTVSPGATLAGGRARMTGPDCGITGH